MVSPAGQPAVVGTKLTGTDQALSAVTAGEGCEVLTCCTNSGLCGKSVFTSQSFRCLSGFHILTPGEIHGGRWIPQPSSWLGPCDLRSRAVRNKLASVLDGKESGKYRELWEC